MPCANRTLPALPVNKPSTPTKMVTVACCLYVCCVAQSQPDDDAHVAMTAASPVNIYTHNPDSPQHQQPAGSGTTPPHSPLAAGEASPRHGHHEGHAGIVTSATAATPQPVQQVTPPLVSRPGTSHGRGHSRSDAGQRATSASSSRPGTAQRQRVECNEWMLLETPQVTSDVQDDVDVFDQWSPGASLTRPLQSLSSRRDQWRRQ